MWVAIKTLKRPSDEEGDPSSSKRQRIASTTFQDSIENGQNALGITFGETEAGLPANFLENDLEIEIADSQEDAEDKNEGAKPANDKNIPRLVPLRSDNGKFDLLFQDGDDVKTRLAAKFFTFNIREIKTIVRWMRLHRTYKVTSHKADFNELARYLGYTDPSLSPEDQAGLRSKLRVKMAALQTNMRKTGGITDEADGYESSAVFQPLPFAEWTKMWYKKGWDGSLSKPDRAKYEAVMNELDDDDDDDHNDPVCSDEEDYFEARGHYAWEDATSQKASAPAPAEAEAESQVATEHSHHDDGYNGPEIFVVEENPQVLLGKELSPPKEDEFAEAKAWNQYLLNKEIIDEHDWNYRVIVAQNLGINLKDLAVLYPDPFPGYEPPAGKDSAPDTITATSTVPSTPTAPPIPISTSTDSKTARDLFRPHSEDSISIGSADSACSDKVPHAAAHDYAEEELGDDELEAEDEDKTEDEDVDMLNGHESQASTANSVDSTADTPGTSSEPRTPQRCASHQSRTPRSITPGLYSAVWSPRDPKD
ncbi:hypothetical protein BKA65DRAFT_571963 [Rhexocercosporidium sp. MPI-PUGE-AT-0058]|nr:hypothetical protein BKA65DRAFT_571963 [Rhexocercosporidium sp. MPI-PUGE-AT-0058]